MPSTTVVLLIEHLILPVEYPAVAHAQLSRPDNWSIKEVVGEMYFDWRFK